MADQSKYNFPAIQTTFPAPFVAHVEINRSKNYNSFNPESACARSLTKMCNMLKYDSVFASLASVFDRLSDDENVRCILLSGVGKHFSAGLDVWSRS